MGGDLLHKLFKIKAIITFVVVVEGQHDPPSLGFGSKFHYVLPSLIGVFYVFFICDHDMLIRSMCLWLGRSHE